MSRRPGLAWLNVLLYGLQLAITLLLDPTPALPSRLATPLTPTSEAGALALPIALATIAMLITDLVWPRFSLFALAGEPATLRGCFAASCVLHGATRGLDALGFVHLAALGATLAWLTWLPLYVFANMERDAGRPFRWRAFLASELAVRLQLAWSTVLVVTQWTASLETFSATATITPDALGLGLCLALLGVLVVVAVAAVVYAHDPVFGLVVAWTLVALAHKEPHGVDGSELGAAASRERAIAIQAAATLGAGVLMALTVLAVIEHKATQERYPPYAAIHQGQSTPTPPTSSTAPRTGRSPEDLVMIAAAADDDDDPTSGGPGAHATDADGARGLAIVVASDGEAVETTAKENR